MSASKTLIVPSGIPWESITGHALETCVYWLLEALGAKKIDWRVGGSGSGTADGGRDLECVFNVPEPSGEVIPQNWWVEVKGRTGTVSASDIKSSVLTAAGKQDVDVHLIVTNQQFSNPTKDWISEWKKTHRRPDIRIWEKQDLERLVSRNPIVAVRLFPKALTVQGKCDVMTTRFWEYMIYTDVPTLKALWKSRQDFEWDDRSLFSALASECAVGDLTKRPWGSIIPIPKLITVYLNGLINAIYLMLRADAAGARFDPVVEGLAHILTHLIARFEPGLVAKLTEEFSELSERECTFSEELRRAVIDPVVGRAIYQASDACLVGCPRVFGDRVFLNEEEAEEYWQRFRTPLASGDEEDEEENESGKVYIERDEGSCSVGLPLSKKNRCPMIHFSDNKSLEDQLTIIRPVIIARTGLGPISSDE